MANHASALKRQRQSEKRRLRNRGHKSAINTTIKKIFGSLNEKESDKARELYREAVARLDSAVSKGALHRKTASRKISRLTKMVNAQLS
ncbi:MAG TPA: 30S ribosomal protein S20 [Desulfomonilia bacterium]|nr:30S ribosomal protein S20 [Desulfomonilia bacterium]